ncbi:MAG: GFA family protein [Pseudomonadales bacterium]|nr:GFA family protein [Pseudomonadales bacterium]
MLQGGCLCGCVRYEVGEFLTPPVHCNCATCRKRQGAAISTNAGVSVNQFRLLSGDELINSFESSPGKRGYFCSACGSHLYAKHDSREALILRLGCLDDDQEVPPPTAHIWRSDAAEWFDPKEQLKELPEGRRPKST